MQFFSYFLMQVLSLFCGVHDYFICFLWLIIGYLRDLEVDMEKN